jgi:hypothetical protein
MRSMLVASTTPTVITSPAMRRLSRPSGAISRRAATAVRMAGMQAPATGIGISSMFRLFKAQPLRMIFTLPPTRGMVSFDAVTSQLPPEQQTIKFARGSDAFVEQMPPRPAFVITGEPVPVISGITRTILGGRAGELARDPREPRGASRPT